MKGFLTPYIDVDEFGSGGQRWLNVADPAGLKIVENQHPGTLGNEEISEM